MSNDRLSAAIYGGLLVVLLGGAWVRWTAGPPVELDGKVVLVDGDADDLERIVFTITDKETATLTRKEDAFGTYWWVEHTKTDEKKAPPPPPPVPGGPDTPPEPPPEPVVEKVTSTQVFKAGTAGDDLAKSMSPLLALRKLEGVDAAKSGTIGLDAPVEFLEITRKGRTTRIALGGEVYGTRDRYAREEGTGTLYLVDDETLRPLKFARTRLPDRDLWPFAQNEITALGIVGPGGATVELVQKNADDAAKATWARASAPEAPDEQINTWVSQALKLKSTTTPEVLPTTLEDRFSLVLTGPRGKVLTVKVQQEGADGDYYASSEHTRTPVKLLKSAVGPLADDVSTLVEAP